MNGVFVCIYSLQIWKSQRVNRSRLKCCKLCEIYFCLWAPAHGAQILFFFSPSCVMVGVCMCVCICVCVCVLVINVPHASQGLFFLLSFLVFFSSSLLSFNPFFSSSLL